MEHELECPKCGFEFTLDEDYSSGYCPNCKEAHYYWDYVLDEDTYEEYFCGYYWEKNKRE